MLNLATFGQLLGKFWAEFGNFRASFELNFAKMKHEIIILLIFFCYFCNMDTRTKLFIKQVGNFLNELVQEKGISVEDFAKLGLTRKDFNEVLLGSKDYNISTLIKVMSVCDVHLEFFDKNERSNFDMLPDDKKPSLN